MNTLLPKGITGFWRTGKTPVSSIDKEIIERLVTKFNRINVFRTATMTEPRVDTNYYVISLFSKTEKYHIGINGLLPYYCGIKGGIDYGTIDFYDLPEFITIILDIHLEELKASFLKQKLKHEYLNLLETSEIEQIKYWETKDIGNVIFNHYD